MAADSYGTVHQVNRCTVLVETVEKGADLSSQGPSGEGSTDTVDERTVIFIFA
jgi:hypothetical protein